jgi:hypothetical protein
MRNYAGNPANNPANIRLIEDSDPPNAANFTAGMQDLADRTAWTEANAILASGGIISGILGISGELVLSGTAVAIFGGGTSAIFESSALLELQSGALLKVDGGANIGIESGGLIQVLAGGQIQLFGAQGLVGGSASAIQGGVAGSIESLVAGAFRLSGGANDWQTFKVARTRNVQHSFKLPPSGTAAGWAATPFAIVGPGPGAQVQVLLLENLHNGATLSAINIYFVVPDPHSGGVPGTMPTFEVFRVPMIGGAPPTPQSLMTGGVPFSFPTPASGSAWHASGNLQSQFVALATAGLNVIDTSQYRYYIQLVDEDGANAAGNDWWNAQLDYGAIVDMRFQ